jgi:hypothetical protein
MGLLNRGQLLKKEEFKIEKVSLGINPETQEEEYVYVREMSGKERDEFESMVEGETQKERMKDFRAKLACSTVCDEVGNIILEMADYELLSRNMTITTLEKIITASMRVNALSKNDQADIVKNSNADLTGGSTSDSAKS